MWTPRVTEATRVRAEGRKQFLVYLQQKLTKHVKKLAVDDDMTPFAIVEESVRLWAKGERR
jgi:hypothetical protein